MISIGQGRLSRVWYEWHASESSDSFLTDWSDSWNPLLFLYVSAVLWLGRCLWRLHGAFTWNVITQWQRLSHMAFLKYSNLLIQNYITLLSFLNWHATNKLKPLKLNSVGPIFYFVFIFGYFLIHGKMHVPLHFRATLPIILSRAHNHDRMLYLPKRSCPQLLWAFHLSELFNLAKTVKRNKKITMITEYFSIPLLPGWTRTCNRASSVEWFVHVKFHPQSSMTYGSTRCLKESCTETRWKPMMPFRKTSAIQHVWTV